MHTYLLGLAPMLVFPLWQTVVLGAGMHLAKWALFFYLRLPTALQRRDQYEYARHDTTFNVVLSSFARSLMKCNYSVLTFDLSLVRCHV